MSRCLSCVLALLVVMVLVGFPVAHARPQAPPAAPALDLVPVNVHVLDKNGKPVTDLKQSDFTVLEDGVPQQIGHFSVETLASGAASPDARPVLRKGISLIPQDHRTFVLFLGLGRLEEPSRSISGLLRFVKTRLLPQDQVAIFAYDRALPFTTDHQKVVDILERFKKSHEDVDFQLGQQLGPTGMAPLYGNRTLPKKLQTRIDELILGPGAKPATPTTAEVLDTKVIGEMSLDDFMASTATTLQDQSSLLALMEYLRRFDGDKDVLFVTEKGFIWPSDENDVALASAANDARVAIHTLQAGGLLEAEPAKEMNATLQQAMSFRSLRKISELTGGLPAITEKGQAALEKLDDSTRSGYLLGYQASNKALDGTYRNIVVRVSRPDTTVLYRHGYFREPVLSGFSRRALIANDRLASAGNFRREVNDIKVKAGASQKAGGSLAVEGKIDLTKVKLATVDGARVGLLNLAVFGFDSASNPMGTHVQELSLKMSEEEYARCLKDWFPFSIQFPIIRGTQNVRFIVYDFGSDLIGRADTRVY
jgi:VWFA-related protein